MCNDCFKITIKLFNQMSLYIISKLYKYFNASNNYVMTQKLRSNTIDVFYSQIM